MIVEFFCTICHEAYTGSQDIYSAPCGHVFHHRCITEWFNQSSGCPDCRCVCSNPNLTKIFLTSRNIDSEDLQESNSTLKTELEQALKNLSETQLLFEECKKNAEDLQKQLDAVTKQRTDLQRQQQYCQVSTKSLEDDLDTRKAENLKIKKDLDEACEKINDLKKTNLFEYAKNLEKVGFKEVFYEDTEVYARQNEHPKVHIISKEQVEDLIKKFKEIDSSFAEVNIEDRPPPICTPIPFRF